MRHYIILLMLLIIPIPVHAAAPMPYDSYLMCVEGRDLPCNSVRYGEFRNDLVPIIRAHASYMARTGRLGHAGWNDRVKQIRKIIPDGNPCEVVATISGAKSDQDAVAQMFKMWRKSPGHWKCINKKARFYCYSLAKVGRVYYAVGIVIVL